MTEQRGITVTQLNNYIKQVFEAEELLHNVEVIGELSGVKQTGNQVYFTLRDKDASIQCVCFIPAIMKHRDGEQVIVRGTVSYWNKAGKISFVVNKCEKVGLSPLYLLFLQLQEKLRAEGLFDTAVKKSIPPEVKRIGVVTSKTGAVIHDIKTVAWRRNPNIDIVVVDTRVQGSGAEIEIARAIELVKNAPTPPDVIIVARGGGSAEDLAPFNTEAVARAVFASKIPVVSAVGHESDFTLIDFVADLRAPTPSAAAELCVREILTQRDRTIQAWNSMRSVVMFKLQNAIAGIGWRDLCNTTTMRFGELENKFNLLATQIEAHNPMAILRKGFARPQVDLNSLQKGDHFDILYLSKDKIKKGTAEWKN